MITPRTKRTQNKYQKFIDDGFLEKNGCRLCQIQTIKKFKYWRIINNEFPWDRIAKTHNMIVTKRHMTYNKLNRAEKKEFEIIKSSYMQKKYDQITESTNKKKTIPAHFHIHLIVLKD